MKRPVTFELEENVINLAEERARSEGMTFGELVQAAIVYYLAGSSLESAKRMKAYKFFCEQPFKISGCQFMEIVKEI